MTSSYVRFAGSGGDEWNGILVEVIGSFSDFSCRDSLPAPLPETLARLAAVYGGEERRPMPATPPSPQKKLHQRDNQRRNCTRWGTTPQSSISWAWEMKR